MKAELISIVVPAYREAANIASLAERIHKVMSAAELAYELIIVDDDSGDGTEQIVCKLHARQLPVSIIVRKKVRGLSSAVLAGFRQASGGILVSMDADLSHPPETIPTMIECLYDGKTDFVLGSRYIQGGGTAESWGLSRRLNSNIAAALARPLVKVADPLSGFFALPRNVLDSADNLNPIGWKIALELMVKCRYRSIREIPIMFDSRRSGKSKLNLGVQLSYLKHLALLIGYKYFRHFTRRS